MKRQDCYSKKEAELKCSRTFSPSILKRMRKCDQKRTLRVWTKHHLIRLVRHLYRSRIGLLQDNRRITPRQFRNHKSCVSNHSPRPPGPQGRTVSKGPSELVGLRYVLPQIMGSALCTPALSSLAPPGTVAQYGAKVANPVEDTDCKLWWFLHLFIISVTVQNARAIRTWLPPPRFKRCLTELQAQDAIQREPCIQHPILQRHSPSREPLQRGRGATTGSPS